MKEYSAGSLLLLSNGIIHASYSSIFYYYSVEVSYTLILALLIDKIGSGYSLGYIKLLPKINKGDLIVEPWQ